MTASYAFVELEYNRVTDQWHPHLHCLLIGQYMPFDNLRAAWLSITKDSHIVHITLAKSTNDVAAYACKYSSKPLNHKCIAVPERLAEAIDALHGRRLIIRTGTATDVNLFANDDPYDWEPVASLQSLLQQAKDGDTAAIDVIAALRERITADPTAAVGRDPPDMHDPDLQMDYEDYSRRPYDNGAPAP